MPKRGLCTVLEEEEEEEEEEEDDDDDPDLGRTDLKLRTLAAYISLSALCCGPSGFKTQDNPFEGVNFDPKEQHVITFL